MGPTSKFYDLERREFIRVRAELPVKYKFLSQDPNFSSDEIYDGLVRCGARAERLWAASQRTSLIATLRSSSSS